MDISVVSADDTGGLVENELPPAGSSKNHNVINGDNSFQSAGLDGVAGKVGGLTVGTTFVFLVGEMAGSGVLALPSAVVNAGWIGIPLIVLCGFVSGYNGINLGKCWIILQERYPEYREHIRYPYPAIGEKAVGKWMRYVVSFCIDFTLFGVATVFLLIACQNIQSLLSQAGADISFCYWLLVTGALLIPLSWLGTPKDFWPIAVGATIATAIACILCFIAILLDIKLEHNIKHHNPGFKSFFFAFGTILFSFGGASTFPTVQHDMREPRKFSIAVALAYLIMLAMYLPVSMGGYFVYGDQVEDNILQSLSGGWMRITVEILITAHLLLAFVIALNPFAQEFEGIFNVPNRFHWKRCVLRTVMVLCIVFTAESIPHFGAILSFVGGSTITFLTFVAPSLFYLILVPMKGAWPERSLPLHVKVINIEIMLVGVVGGIASMYSAGETLFTSDTFVPPCYVNITAASLQN